MQYARSWLMAVKTGRPVGHNATCHVMAATTGRPVGLAHNTPCHGCKVGDGCQWALPVTRHVLGKKTRRPVGLACNVPCDEGEFEEGRWVFPADCGMCAIKVAYLGMGHVGARWVCHVLTLG